MSKIFLLFFSFSMLFCADISWDHQHRYTLKKDEIAHITIATTESKGLDKSEFFFRWTLLVGDRVTLLVNAQGYPHQYILYKKRSLDRVDFQLLPNGESEFNDKTNLLLVLSDIGQSKKEIDFDIFIQDNKKRILVDFHVPEEK
ncbi:MAG TPA: hypothetical protein CFH79_06020 [Sulfurospirillum sp. UBA11407]|jgi:hypothetical protein|nr:MAG TPA: hypothetical protein CFH79_06020 [Sulfurospirillum sp. UBA11407]